jgi:predicted dehydrogenase
LGALELMKIGLIGLGRHGMRYARHLLEPDRVAEVVAVCRRDATRGADFAKQHGLRFYDDYHDLIADEEVQAVVVVTPPGRTKEICLTSVKAGKPVLVEKPIAVTAEDAWQMARAAEAVGVPLMTGQTLRFDQAVQALKASTSSVGSRRYLVLTNRIEPRQDQWRNPTDYGGRGVLLEVGIHLLDLIRFLTDEEVAEVRCETDVIGAPESRAWATLRTESGLTCLLDVSRVAPGRVGRAEWIGENGQLIADWSQHQFVRLAADQRPEQRHVPDSPTLVATLRAFVGALAHHKPMPITGWDGQRAVAIAEACYESAASGRPVRLRGVR